jgi:hypothetical protein
MEKPAQFMQEIVCPTCTREGHATWEASDVPGGLRHLASLSDGFKMWPERQGEDPKITCTTQPDEKSVGA